MKSANECRETFLSRAASGTPLLAGAAFFSKLQLALWRGAAIITTAADIYIRVYCNWRDATAAGNSRNNCPAFFSPFFILGGQAGEMKGAGVAQQHNEFVCCERELKTIFTFLAVHARGKEKEKSPPFLSRWR
jgi:hypothetical protein